jgi:hypothetical protein
MAVMKRMSEELAATTTFDSIRVAQQDQVNARPGILALLPRGETIRNFVHSGALDVAAHNAEVSLLTVIPDDEYRQMAEEHFDRVIELQSYPESYAARFLRDQLDLAHGRWLWSEAAKERWRLRDHEANTPLKKIKRLAKKMSCLPFANPAGLALLERAESFASTWLRRTDAHLNLFRELNPALVFNASHIHSRIAIPAVHAAKSLGITTTTFLFSWDNLTSQGRIVPLYDYYLAWNEEIRRQLLSIYPGIRPDQVFVTGTPQFDFHFQPQFHWSREQFCDRVGADPTRPIVLYTTGMDNHMPGEPLIIEGINNLLKEMTEFGRPQLLVRVYPKDRNPQRFDEIKRRNPDILFPHVPWTINHQMPKPEDAYLLTNSLRHAAVGINVASTVSLELCMFDKPVINVAYNPPIDISPKDYRLYYQFDHYRPVVESGAVQLARSEAEMKQLLIEALAEPQKHSANRKNFIQRMFGETLDGQSGERVAEVLLQLARNHHRQ